MTIFVLRQATITLRIMVYLELLQLEQARLPTSFNILDFLDRSLVWGIAILGVVGWAFVACASSWCGSLWGCTGGCALSCSSFSIGCELRCSGGRWESINIACLNHAYVKRIGPRGQRALGADDIAIRISKQFKPTHWYKAKGARLRFPNIALFFFCHGFHARYKGLYAS